MKITNAAGEEIDDVVLILDVAEATELMHAVQRLLQRQKLLKPETPPNHIEVNLDHYHLSSANFMTEITLYIRQDG